MATQGGHTPASPLQTRAGVTKNGASNELRGSTPAIDRGTFKLLSLFFCAWKVLHLCLAAFCPGPGYDTSALVASDPSSHRHEEFTNLSRPHRLSLNLYRWDAFYFVGAAQRGYLYEQDWAFGRTYSQILRLASQYIPTGFASLFHPQILAGILVATICHYISVFVLYRLLTIVLAKRQRHSIALVASILHIMTPASLFYLAPYAESMFACLNLVGMLLYTISRGIAIDGGPAMQEDAYKLASGVVFASAVLLRSNGLLNGLIYLYEVAQYVPLVLTVQLSFQDARRVFVTCLAGIVLAVAFISPQYVAYTEFCIRNDDTARRPWCERHVPSIYTWVQSHYWNVGLFRYWTMPNIPLFALAAPMVWLLLWSSVTILRSGVWRKREQRNELQATPAWSLPELALPQMVLAVTAMTSFHVQIINRIASAYPIWYATIASWLVERAESRRMKSGADYGQWAIRGIVIYSLVQGTLFANFLPPA